MLAERPVRQIKQISKETVSVDIEKIVVPGWYPKKFISTVEMNHAKELIKQGKLGWESIIVRYVHEKNSDRKYYELIKGLLGFRALQELGRSQVECEVIDDERVDKKEAIIASLSYSCLSPLNHWESTIAGLSYLVEELQLKTIETWYTVPTIGTRKKKTVSQLDRAIGKCNFVLIKRRAELSLRAQKEDYKKKVDEEATPEVERAVERMLQAIGVDLTTFVQKRIPLTKLPKDITNALSLGSLHYSKAISLSRVGATNQIRALVDVLEDIDVINAINSERKALLEKTLTEKWSNSKLNEEIILANNRILIIGTNEDHGALSVDEIGDRKEVKEDLKLQADLVSVLTRCRAKANNFKFIASLTDREKSTFFNRVRAVKNILADLERKVEARKS